MTPQQLRSQTPIPVELGDDFRVQVRPIVGTDRERIHRAYELLSERSRLNRFWTTAVQMSDGLAGQLAATNDCDHIGWIALDPEDDEFPGFGAASLWIEKDDPTRAETSLTVADCWQRKGLGTLLYSLLWFEGWEMGVRHIYGVGRAGNHEVRSWWESLGGEVKSTSTSVEILMDLVSPEKLVQRVSWDVHASDRQVDLAGWMKLWLDLAAEE